MKDSNSSIETNALIWTDKQAFEKQIKQIGASACGASAILNVFNGLDFKYESIEKVCQDIKVNLRVSENESRYKTLGDYLFSRSVAGMNATGLIENIEKASLDQVSGRFFSFYPKPIVNISEWLSEWIKKGAVPVALLNLQKTPFQDGSIPDAWHHQMIYRCTSDRIYLTNPIEYKSIDLIMNELVSDSVLLVRSIDIKTRFNLNKYDLNDLISYDKLVLIERERWIEFNVLGQVLYVLFKNDCIDENFIRSNKVFVDCFEKIKHIENLTHVKIPAAYKSGIALFAYKNSNVFKELQQADDL